MHGEEMQVSDWRDVKIVAGCMYVYTFLLRFIFLSYTLSFSFSSTTHLCSITTRLAPSSCEVCLLGSVRHTDTLPSILTTEGMMMADPTRGRRETGEGGWWWYRYFYCLLLEKSLRRGGRSLRLPSSCCITTIILINPPHHHIVPLLTSTYHDNETLPRVCTFLSSVLPSFLCHHVLICFSGPPIATAVAITKHIGMSKKKEKKVNN